MCANSFSAGTPPPDTACHVRADQHLGRPPWPPAPNRAGGGPPRDRSPRGPRTQGLAAAKWVSKGLWTHRVRCSRDSSARFITKTKKGGAQGRYGRGQQGKPGPHRHSCLASSQNSRPGLVAAGAAPARDRRGAKQVAGLPGCRMCLTA